MKKLSSKIAWTIALEFSSLMVLSSCFNGAIQWSGTSISLQKQNSIQISPTTGSIAGGFPVVFSGTTFSPQWTVFIGGAACSNVQTTGATLVCLAPPHLSGPVNVILNDGAGQSTLLSQSFNYVVPALTIASISPSAGPLAGGTPLTLTGTGFATGATITVGGSVCSSVVVSSSTTAACNLPASAAGTFGITITNPDLTTFTFANAYTFATAPAFTYAPASRVMGQSLVASSIDPILSGGPITACSSAPTLPTGLSFTPGTCQIVGTPLVALVNSPFTITATGPGGTSAGVTLNIRINAPVIALSSGSISSCAIQNSQVYCWGDNSGGELGDTTTIARASPVPVSLPAAPISVAVGGSSAAHACAALSSGQVYCWGYGTYGQLGNSASSTSATPVLVSGNSTAQSVSAGARHSCASLSNGTIKCWGDDTYGQLGDGAVAQQNSPVTVAGLGGSAIAVTSGYQHTCALLSDHTVKCWGLNSNGQLGNSSTTNSLSPVVAAGITANSIASGSGSLHTCATLANGAVQCWGSNSNGQIGDATLTDRWVPTTSGMINTTAVVAGDNSSCGLNPSGVQCWGAGVAKQLGDGGVTDKSSPSTLVPGSAGAQFISAGQLFSCMVDSVYNVKCWGNNASHQLGDGTTTSNGSPVQPI